MLDALKAQAEKSEVSFVAIDSKSTGAETMERVKSFQENDDLKLAIISLDSGNSNLELTKASTIIFSEISDSPNELITAEEMAHQVGQRQSIVCHYLMGENTLDEFFFEKMERKLALLSVGKEKTEGIIESNTYREKKEEEIGRVVEKRVNGYNYQSQKSESNSNFGSKFNGYNNFKGKNDNYGFKNSFKKNYNNNYSQNFNSNYNQSGNYKGKYSNSQYNSKFQNSGGFNNYSRNPNYSNNRNFNGSQPFRQYNNSFNNKNYSQPKRNISISQEKLNEIVEIQSIMAEEKFHTPVYEEKGIKDTSNESPIKRESHKFKQMNSTEERAKEVMAGLDEAFKEAEQSNKKRRGRPKKSEGKGKKKVKEEIAIEDSSKLTIEGNGNLHDEPKKASKFRFSGGIDKENNEFGISIRTKAVSKGAGLKKLRSKKSN